MIKKYGGMRVPVLAFAALSLVMSACASKSSSGTGSGGGSANNTGTGGGSISTANISGIGTILVNGQGYTLYYLTTDQHSTPTCTGSCASTWPPEMVSGAVPAAGSGVSGTLGTVAFPGGGKQLTYMGWPLYTYSNDTAPGQANGQGSQGTWFAMKSSGPTTTGGSGGSGGSGGGKYGGY